MSTISNSQIINFKIDNIDISIDNNKNQIIINNNNNQPINYDLVINNDNNQIIINNYIEKIDNSKSNNFKKINNSKIKNNFKKINDFKPDNSKSYNTKTCISSHHNDSNLFESKSDSYQNDLKILEFNSKSLPTSRADDLIKIKNILHHFIGKFTITEDDINEFIMEQLNFPTNTQINTDKLTTIYNNRIHHPFNYYNFWNSYVKYRGFDPKFSKKEFMNYKFNM